MDKLKAVVFEMATNKVAGPDGFNAEFYKKKLGPSETEPIWSVNRFPKRGARHC
jgi:hypothetical protein